MPSRQIPEADEAESPDEDESPGGPDWWVFDSSRVVEAAYDKSNDALYVRFVKPTPGEVEYVYQGVPQNVWRNFRRSQSPGKFINRVLNDFDYHRTR